MSSAHKVTDHDHIRGWAEEHGAKPSLVKGTGDGEHEGVLRLHFGEEDDKFHLVEWDEWFKVFEESKLAILIDKDKAQSRFAKLVRRD